VTPVERGEAAHAQCARPPTEFADRLLVWQANHGRRGLPWQSARDPYRVWLSEIMLQQTQVATVVPYYRRFLARFPTVRALAAAPEGDVLSVWSGLGYYSRARNLHACAKLVVAEYRGRFPRTAEALARLPGIGRSTAAAIAAFCFGERVAILDGNVKRVLVRYFAIDGFAGSPAVEKLLWRHAAALLPASAEHMPRYTQGIMDLGALVCTRRAPLCDRCPVSGGCMALRQGRVEHLPVPRPRRSAPQRTAHWLVLVRSGSVLLERRPGAGIWGGLLAPPQFERHEELLTAARRLGAAEEPRPLPARRHAFTHFTLHFTPHVARARPAAAIAHESGVEWLALERAGSAPLPAPVRVLLEELHGAKAEKKGHSGVMRKATRKRETML
jgi:A/G-specific adenine glycosylase